MHDVLFFSTLFYGESATMASESACMGVPAIFIDSVGRGYTEELENRYGLLFNFPENDSGINWSLVKAAALISQAGIKEKWRCKKEMMLQNK
jgi:predicted glycosyltransferase